MSLKISIQLLIVTSLIVIVKNQIIIPEKINNELLQTFNEWKAIYKKVYKTPGEEAVRRMIFGMNMMKITANNDDPERTFEMKANYFADMTQGEFSMILGTRNVTMSGMRVLQEDDFVDDGSNTIRGPVSVTCGSCYAFSSAHVAAWHHCKKNGNQYINFSKQQLVDCSYRDNGCTNGWTSTASNYIATHGIAAEADYPYESKKNKCMGRKLRDAKLYKPISGTTRVEKNNEEAMKSALAEHGPLLIIIDGSSLAFYSSGVITGKSCEHGTVNHAVILAAYKSGGSKGYWRVKNHWGADWGENGYFNLEAFSPVDQGCLGIAGFPSYAY
uniref:CSON013275 protein n=1 Tax=Culicoides sonorensis TaxID=179676 RepID=A0A336MAC4_CULSO